jgi:hypothetical protein
MIALRKLVFPCLVGAVSFSLPGCGGAPRYVGVSGVVTLNGKPYKGAVVNFQPIGTPDNPYPGRGSYGHTDENGRFTLVMDDKTKGAVAGKHRVRIATMRESSGIDFDPALGTPDGYARRKPKKLEIDPIPPEWNNDSTKEVEVPPGGTDTVNFDIVSKRR